MNTRGSRSSSRHQRGVTLVELVTVIVIIGAVGAMVIPRWFDNQVFEERGYIDDLAGAIRHSQRIALASGCEVQVTVTANGYSAMQRAVLNTCNTAGAWTQPVARQGGTPVASTAPNGVVTNPATTFVFAPDGSVNGAPPPVLSVGTFTLSVDAPSGVVVVLP